ncbi:MAG TPA: RNA methyltransferase [Acidimicrobiales bacterium]|nr:MAG: hypothetical protein B7X07_06480 [Actinobacteria bacterium 21-64-8]HQT98954.1 RNA methyltransferase [Acidimicrobiales bacterium]
MRRLRRLANKRALRWSEGVCVIEGPDLVESALESGVEFEALYVSTDVAEGSRSPLVTRCLNAGVRVFALQPAVFSRVADTKTPQGLLATVRMPVATLAALERVTTLIVLCDVQDPGNAGTIIRSGDAAGVSAVVLCGQSVDPFNPKTLRASAGSVFHLPLVVCAFDDLVAFCAERKIQMVASLARHGLSPREVDLARASALLIGNEATGLAHEQIEACSLRVTIPMAGAAESLNAGVAGALLAFEALYQRQGASDIAPRSSL